MNRNPFPPHSMYASDRQKRVSFVCSSKMRQFCLFVSLLFISFLTINYLIGVILKEILSIFLRSVCFLFFVLFDYLDDFSFCLSNIATLLHTNKTFIDIKLLLSIKTFVNYLLILYYLHIVNYFSTHICLHLKLLFYT
jgi:hypothetical protein